MQLRDDPFIIVSSGRAGSTLLTTLLNGHPAVFVPPESDFLARAYPYFHDRTDFGESELETAVRMFRTTSQDKGWGMSESYLLSTLRDQPPKNFGGLNRAFYLAYCRSKHVKVRYWGIKRPVLIASIGRILEVHPGAKIINILRDGRDVFLSYNSIHEKGPRWGPDGPVSCALYWVDGLRRVARAKQVNIHEIRYEDLVSNPAREMQSLCRFLEIPFDESMVKRDDPALDNKNIVIEKHKNTVHENIGKAIDKDNVDKFITQMRAPDIWLFEMFAAPYLEKYGYAPVHPILASRLLAPVQHLAYALAQFFNDIRYRKRDRDRYLRATRGRTND